MRQSISRITGRQVMNSPIQRRTYSVAGPNALWHLDGNHKLIKWRLVIHGAIDGFSRMITFLQCSSNNRAETVLDCFVKATQEYGMPSRVRTDRGGENVAVWNYIEDVRGQGRGSYLAGSSVHNTRIERLWRDVFASVSPSYRATFCDLQQMGALNPENEADLFSLHYIFVPRINASLKAFQSAWNNHPLSTENNKSPLQLYTAYSIGSYLFDEVIDPSTYGIDSEITCDGDDTETVVVPETNIPLSPASVQQLQSRINPMHSSDDFGKQLYLDTVQLLFSLMQNDNLI